MDEEIEIQRVRQNIRNLQRKLLIEEMTGQETLLKIERYKAMSVRISEKIQNIKWKIFKANFIQNYEKAKRQGYLDKMERCKLYKLRPKVSRSSRRNMGEYRELRRILSNKLEALVKRATAKEQQVFDLELKLKQLKEDNTCIIHRLLMDLEKKEEEEKKLEDTLEQIKTEEENIDFSTN